MSRARTAGSVLRCVVIGAAVLALWLPQERSGPALSRSGIRAADPRAPPRRWRFVYVAEGPIYEAERTLCDSSCHWDQLMSRPSISLAY